MCVLNLMFTKMANEDVNVLDVMYGVEFDVGTSNISNPEYEDVFKDIDFDCSSELSSLSNDEHDTKKPSEVQTRRHLVIGKHIETIDGEQKKYKCTICKSQFSWKHQIRYHDYCVTGKRPLKCELCDKRFIKKSHLIYHTRTHSGESPYKCSICPKNFKQLGKLKRHEKIHKELGEVDKLQCGVCEKFYCDRDSLKKHERKHSKKEHVGNSHAKQRLTAKVSKFICEVCGRRFRRKNSLNIHLQMHEDNYPHPCSECRKTFRTKKELNQHKVVHDKSNPRFECSLCSVMFGRKDNLLRHVRNCHLDPCAKKDQNPKKVPEDSLISDAEEVCNSKGVDNVKESPTVTACDPSFSADEFSQTSSEKNRDCSEKSGLMNKDSNEKKTNSVVKKRLSSKQKDKNKIGKKKETEKLERSGTINSETLETTKMPSPGFSNVTEHDLGDDKPEDFRRDRKSVLKTTSTVSEAPVDLTKAESLTPERSQGINESCGSAKTSVIVHTSSLLHEANSRREPVIKFFRPPAEPKTLTPDPT